MDSRRGSERQLEAARLRARGTPLKYIGERLGVSPQRAGQLAALGAPLLDEPPICPHCNR